jgi:hypothetical protein
MDRRIGWTIVSYPNEGWAQTIYGEPDVEQLWKDVEHAIRLDEPDPVAAWNEHIDRLDERCRLLNERRFDAIRFRGPGTDLTVGLNKKSRWASGNTETEFGRRHVPNMPTEEVRGHRSLDHAARAPRQHHPRSRTQLRRRSRGRRQGLHRRGLRARAGCGGRGRSAAR